MPQAGDRSPYSFPLILDLRAPCDFHASHLAHSYNIEACTLKRRYSYLPPRDQPFLVVANVDERSTVQDAMRDHRGAHLVFLSGPENTGTRTNGPVTDAGIFFEKAEKRGVLRCRSASQSRMLSPEDVPTLLFQPSKAVRRIVIQMEDEMAGTARRRVLDLGCGAARDLIWILHRYRETQVQSKSACISWRGVGIDNWKATLTRAQWEMRELGLTETEQTTHSACEALIWAKCSDEGAVLPLTGTGKGKAIASDTSVAEDIEALRLFRRLGLNMSSADELPEEQRYDLVICVRFYPLATLMRLSSLVKMNGFVLISHFVSLDEDEKAAASQRQPFAIVDYDSPPHEGRIRRGQIENLVHSWNAAEFGRCRWVIQEDIYETIEDGRLVRSVALHKVNMESNCKV